MRRTIGLILLAASATGCGRVRPPSDMPVGTTVFAKNCRACHSLIGNESRHRQGGDLSGYSLTRQALLEYTREMPTRRPLTAAEQQAVVGYVFAVEQRTHAR